jgi:hypothetical protein
MISDNLFTSIFIIDFIHMWIGILVILWGFDSKNDKLTFLGVMVLVLAVAVISAMLQY